MMKRILLCWMLITAVFSGLAAQNCDLKIGDAPFFSAPLPSVLELMTGDFPLPSEETVARMTQARPGTDAFGWLDYQIFSGSYESAAGYCSAETNFSSPATTARGRLYAGISMLGAGDFGKAAAVLSIDPDSCIGTAFRLKIVARYLDKYQITAEKPLFSHFNGGFANYLSDSIPGTKDEKSVQLGKALQDLLALHRLFGGKHRHIEELCGDLLLSVPAKFEGKWTAAVTYLAAGTGLSGEDSAGYERKAIYCLESDQMNAKYFNVYRFKKLQKNIVDEQAAAAERRQAFAGKEADWLGQENPGASLSQFYPGYPAPSEKLEFLPERAGSSLMQQIIEEQARSMKADAGPDPNANPMNPDIDLKAIKSNVRYNFYAIGLILVVIGAAVFFWLKLRKATREQNN